MFELEEHLRTARIAPLRSPFAAVRPAHQRLDGSRERPQNERRQRGREQTQTAGLDQAPGAEARQSSISGDWPPLAESASALPKAVPRVTPEPL